jgi:outer membrane PBP1 activator LpoA protein
MNKKVLPLIAYTASILAFIGGCAPTTTTDSVLAPVVISNEVTDSSMLALAETALQAALLSERPDAQLLDAAILFATAGELQKSADSLLLVVTEELDDQQYIRYSFFAAELDLSLARPAAAAKRLKQERFEFVRAKFKTNLQKRTFGIEAEINRLLGNNEQALKAYIQLATLTKGQKDSLEVHDNIWRQLNRMPYSFLQQGNAHDDIQLAGWLQLAELHRVFQNNSQAREAAMKKWQSRWRSHPAAKTPPTGLSKSLIRVLRQDKPPSQVALLLPLQDQYMVPSYTLLDGFMGAYYQLLAQNNAGNSAELPEVRLYDTSKQSIQRAYNNAVEDGAEMVIGPMRRSEVEALMTVPALPVPTLSLNRMDSKNGGLQPENLFQFGLSPLDEMTQIADRAWRAGQRNVLLIAPDNGMGKRASEFFNRYWTAKGGTILSQVAYPSSINDFTPLLKPSLHIDLSEQRGQKLRRYINSSIRFSARRRQDLDLVVLLGYPVKARQIKPALDFLYAADVPVVATSHIYNGTEQQGLDRDLSGVEFSAMPWTLPGQLVNELQPDDRLHTAYRHLYALGHDAFLLHRNLSSLQSEQAVPLFGSTGLLVLSGGIVERQQKWASFQRGRVVEITP